MNQPTHPSLAKISPRRTCAKLGAIAASFMILTTAHPARAASLYWDTNGTTAGTGSTSTGTWGTDADWNSDSTGGSGGSFTATTTGSDTVTFVAGPSVSSGNNAFVVSINGTQSALGIVFASTGAITLGASTGAGTIDLGTGGLTLGTYAYGTTANAAAPTINANVVLGGNQVWNIGPSSLTVNGAISGTGNLSLSGNATKTFNGANSYVGTTTISGSTILTLGGTAGSIGTGDLILSTANNGVTFIQSANQTFSNNITGSGGSSALQVSSAITVTLTGTNTYTGGTVIRGNGAVKVASIANNLGSTGASAIKLGLSTTSGTLIYTGVGETTSKIFQLAGTSAGTGGTLENDGSGALILTGGVANVASGSKILTLQGTNTNNNTIQGVISDDTVSATTSVLKAGAGTWVLSGSNTYTGSTTVNAGILEIDGTQSTGAVTVGGTTASGATGTPTLTGTGTIGGAVTVNGNSSGNVAGKIAAGSSATPQGTLKVGSITFQTGSTFAVSINGANASSLTAAGTTAGTIALGSGATISFSATSPTAGNYLLMQANGGGSASLTGTFGTVGSLPSGYTLVYGATSLNLQQNGILSIATTTTTPFNGHVGSAYAIGVGVTDTAQTGGANLAYTLAGSTGVTISGSSQSATAGGSAVNTSGTYTVQAAGSNSASVSASGTDSLGHSVSGTANYTVVGYNLAVANPIASSVNLGYVHTGGTFGTATLAIGNGATAGSYSEDLSASGSATGLATSTGSISNLQAGSSDSSSVVVGLGGSANTGTAGTKSGSVAVSESSTGTVAGVSNGLGTTSLGTQNVTVTGQVYSGTSTWASSAGGTWGTLASNFGTNWGANQGSPGLDSSFTHTDSATFGSSVASGTAHVTLDVSTGNNPSLKAITFSNAAASYSIDQGTGGGSLVLDGTGTTVGSDANTALVSVTAGSHSITAPVVLNTNTDVDVASVSGVAQQMTISGAISGSGGLKTTDTGTTILSSTAGNTYGGPTTVGAGKLYVNNTTGSGTGSGAVTVNGGTLAGKGIITASSVTVNTGGTLASGDAQSGTTGDGTHLALNSTATTIASANLTFDLGAGNDHLGAGTPGAYNFANPITDTTYLTLTGTSTLNFTGTDSISLVDLTNTTGSNGALALRVNTPYLLATAGSNADYLNLVINSGTTANPIYSLSQNDNGINGWVVGVYTGSGAVNGTNVNAISILQYGSDGVTALTPGPNGVYAAPALYLYGGNLEVVPEPGTWALMLGGLALLVLVQRRKNKQS